MSKPKKIFISHSSEDREFLEREIIPLLRSHGIETWFSNNDIQTADRWERSIRKVLKECDWFLVAVSKNSLDSDWVHREVSWADRNRKGCIVPVVLDGSDPSDLNLVLEGLQHVDYGRETQNARVHLLKTWGIEVSFQRKDSPPSSKSTPSSAPAKPKPTEPQAYKIDFQCPNGHRLNASASLRGKQVKCPTCSTQFIVPKKGEQTRGPSTVAVPQSQELITNSIGMKLKLIPAGEFLMGSSDSDKQAPDWERPQHRVRITQPFYLGVYPVTQYEYERVVGTNPSDFTGDGHRPVEQVLWFDAVSFCNGLSK